MKIVRIYTWLGPIALALVSLLIGLYLLLGPTPKNNFVDPSASVLEPELLQYFTAQADKYAKEEAEKSSPQRLTKSDPI